MSRRSQTVTLMREQLRTAAARLTVFGYVHLPAAIPAALIDGLSCEVDAELQAAFADPHSAPEQADGRGGYFVPTMTERTPTSLDLADELGELVSSILMRPTLASYAEASAFFGATPWHLDSGNSLKSYRAIAYLDPLVDGFGALVFLPGSHFAEYREAFREYERSLKVRDDASFLRALANVPAHVVQSAPGDLIILDEHVWHCSAARVRRRQWGVTYAIATPGVDDVELLRFFRGEFVDPVARGYDGQRFPYLSETWLERDHSRRDWLERLGVTALVGRSAPETLRTP